MTRTHVVHRWSIIAVAWFVLLLIVPTVAGLLGSRPRNLDKRNLAALPSVSPIDFFDREHNLAIDRWSADHLPLRDRAITWQSRIDTDLLHDSGPTLIGRSGWLFLPAEIDRACDPSVSDAQLVDALRQATETADQRRVPVAWIIVPDKATAMPDRVPSDRIDCAVAGHRRLDRAVASAALPVVFPNRELAAGLRKTGGPQLWWHGDSHQTPWGHLVEVKGALDLLEPGLYDPSSVREQRTSNDGDLWQLLGQPRTETIDGAVIDRPDTRTVAQSTETVGPGLALRRYTSSGTDRRLPGRTVVVHDSHFDGPQQLLLAPWFDDVTFVPSDAIDTPAARAAVGHADRLVVEGVERDRPALAEKIPKLAARLPQH
jgi:hypothetical protein